MARTKSNQSESGKTVRKMMRAKAVMAALGVTSRNTYYRLIEDKVLAPPIKLPGSNLAMHFEDEVAEAQERLAAARYK